MSRTCFAIPNDDFARGVLAEYPRLADRDVADIERVTLLRQWAWSHTDYAPSTEAARTFRSDERWVQSAAPEHFARFERLEGGVICGGTAKGLRKLYEHFGYRAWAFGCQCGPDGPSHAVTLVEIDFEGAGRIVVQDASFNLSLHDLGSGEPLSIFEVLTRLRDRSHESIRAVESDYGAIGRWPRFVVAPPFTGKYSLEHYVAKSGYVIEDKATWETLGDGTMVITSPRSWGHFIAKKCYDSQTGQPANVLREIVDRGCPESMLYLYLTRQWVEGPDDKSIWNLLCDAADAGE